MDLCGLWTLLSGRPTASLTQAWPGHRQVSFKAGDRYTEGRPVGCYYKERCFGFCILLLFEWESRKWIGEWGFHPVDDTQPIQYTSLCSPRLSAAGVAREPAFRQGSSGGRLCMSPVSVGLMAPNPGRVGHVSRDVRHILGVLRIVLWKAC